MQRIIKKKIFRIEFDLASALAIGSGENLSTDKDIILGSDKNPYIPASAIAGVCISALDAANDPANRKYRDYWGCIIKNGNDKDYEMIGQSMESRILFYDAHLVQEEKTVSPVVSVRDSVALDEYKTAKPGAKFDMEVVEPGVRFITYVEQLFISDSDPDIGKAVANLFMKGNIRFGGKTARGYGAIDNVCIKTFEVRFDDASEDNRKKIESWACASTDTDGAFEGLNWVDYKESQEIGLDSVTKGERRITICLKQVGGISIRRYTTEAADSNAIAPDYTQLVSTDITLENNKEGRKKQIVKPVIPGTSWAGAFIHQIEKNSGLRRTFKKKNGEAFEPNDIDKMFGYALEGKKKKSQIYFSESLIEGASEKQLSRNAIDRFSGGTKDGALFTEKTYYGGTTKLVIGIAEDLQMTEKIARAFAASIVDLHYGFMAVGGETSIGRGLFTITAMDGIENVPGPADMDSAKTFYEDVLKVLTGQKGD